MRKFFTILGVFLICLLTSCNTYNYVVLTGQATLRSKDGGYTQEVLNEGSRVHISKRTNKKGLYTIVYGHNNPKKAWVLSPRYTLYKPDFYTPNYYKDYDYTPSYEYLKDNTSSYYPPSYYQYYTPPSSGGTVNVRGYYRKDGTYVRPHTRSAPRRR